LSTHSALCVAQPVHIVDASLFFFIFVIGGLSFKVKIKMLSTLANTHTERMAPIMYRAILNECSYSYNGLHTHRYASTATTTKTETKNESLNKPETKFLFPDAIKPEELPKARNTRLVSMRDFKHMAEGKFLTKPMFKHPVWTSEEMEGIYYTHRKCKTLDDYITFYFMRVLRNTFDFCTGYLEPKDKQDQIRIAKSKRRMTREKWLTRFIVLESIAGIPGSVAGFLRHLQSIRLMRRDKAFIETLLDEAYNERMHLLTFMKLGKPGRFARLMLWFGQGIFANLFFLTYIIRPKICHRFVGYLEEEAVLTYTRCLQDMRMGLNPQLYHTGIPQIAKDYWHLTNKDTFYDMILYIRADEAKHREVNHTFANLKLRQDRNPFAKDVPNDPRPQPLSDTLKTHRGTGWDRKDLIL